MYSNTTLIIIFAIAVLLDLLVIRVWRNHRQRNKIQTKSGKSNINAQPLSTSGNQNLAWLKWLWNLIWNPGNVGVSMDESLQEKFVSDSHESTNNHQSDFTQEKRVSSLSIAPFKLILLILGIGLVIASQWIQRHNWGENRQWVVWSILITGLIFFVISQRMSAEREIPPRIKKLLGALFVKPRNNYWQPLCLITSPMLALIASAAAGTGGMMNNAFIAVVAWLGSIFLAIIGGYQKQHQKKISQRTVIIVILLILGGFLIRIVNIPSIPINLSGDEASSGLNAVAFIKGHTDNIFRVGWSSFPSFHAYLQSIPISLFGQTVFAVRFLSVVAGALTIGAVYLLVKTMFNERTALLSTIFLATLHYHNNFSRIGLNNVWDGLWFVVVLGLLWYGWEKEKRNAWLFAGFALGISQYFYVSVRSLFGIVPVWILVVGFLDKPKFRRNLRSIIFMMFIAVATIFPLARFYIQNPNEFMAPMRRVSILGPWMDFEVHLTGKQPWQILLNQIQLSFLGYTHIPLTFWYKAGVPILRIVPAALFYLGIVSLIQKLRESRVLLMGIWLVTVGVMGGLSESAPAAQRYMAVAPALAIIVGLGMDTIVNQLSNLWKSRQTLLTSLAILVMVIIGGDELRFYFYDHIPKSDFGGENSMVAQRLADYLQDKPEDFQVLFFGSPRMGYYSISSLPYLAPHIHGMDMNHSWDSDENPEPTSNHLIFVFLPDHYDQLELVRVDYPSGEERIETISDDRPLYLLYETTP